MSQFTGSVIAAALFLFAGSAPAQNQPSVFTCTKPPGTVVLGLSVLQQRQSIIITGDIFVNCCAPKTYAADLTNGILKVSLAVHGPCECPDQPCLIDLSFGTGMFAVSRVTVTTAENTVLLDTTFARTGLAGAKGTIQKNTVPEHALLYDLQGRVLSNDIQLLLSRRQSPFPRGVYLTGRPGHFIGITVQQ